MATPAPDMRAQLVERRDRLSNVLQRSGPEVHLESLLHDVDEALGRLDTGTYGLCQTCGDPIEADRLEADPLVRFCIDHLSPTETRALEQDLDLAGRVQQTLLPPALLVDRGWEIAYRYRPLGAVSGDYCDAVRAPDPAGGLVVLLGDISGKGVAASMLMAHLHASMRTLVEFGLPLPQLVARANRVFCDSTMANHYATLVSARFAPSGEVEICNAGHCPPLLVRGANVEPIEATGVPVGLFCVSNFASRSCALDPGDMMVLYTDGITEARNPADEEYGEQRLMTLVRSMASAAPQVIVDTCIAALDTFRAGARRTDDSTVMVIKRRA